MGAKRSHAQMIDDGSSSVHHSRRSNISSLPRRKKRQARTEDAKPASVNPLKKRIRDLARLLERAEDMPADVRMDNERALAAHNQELAAAEAEKLKQKMARKYHMVKFFERQKATRRVKQLHRRLSATTETASLRQQLHAAEVDLNYILHYPPDRKYVGLYPQRPKADDDHDDHNDNDNGGGGKGDPAIWREIERRMAAGTLAAGWSRTEEEAGPGELKKRTKQKDDRRAPGESTRTEDRRGDESDGGFFDE
ncbi:hypothetical protein GP486_006939 [Trichoglossum hirsutum]|uniref:rRNA-processing protein EFG1 n=1 Tax=Trichoglossum hirsutum TaxID=265104 RepID=A0A9P8ICU0_9PEZI|nr:hypothetical protein GP486_006939 [Trichoglossum hirsutum]